MKNYIYEIEDKYFSAFACKSNETKGRAVAIEPCPYRTEFQRDRDRILHSKSFRRLKYKTQVFLSPEGDHYRTRLTHTLEVSQIARTIARALRLNEDLVEAIALGHDLGHTPFGHAGEKTLNLLNINGFAHNEQSLRVVDFLENDGIGLNLTAEVRDGILNHKYDCTPSTLEGAIVSYADRIAYVNHDIEDAICAGIMSENDIPLTLSYTLGNSKSKRISALIGGIIEESKDKNCIALPKHLETAFGEIRDFMFESVYKNPIAKSEEIKADKMLKVLYGYYINTQAALPDFYQSIAKANSIDQAVTDYLAGMTDRYAINEFTNIFIPKNWNVQ